MNDQLARERLIDPASRTEPTCVPAFAIAAVGSLILLFGTGLVDRIFPAKNVRLIGAEARDLERSRRERNFADGSLARWIEKEVATRSRTREAVAPWLAAVMLRFGGSAPSNLIAGEDGWLFLRNRVRLSAEALDDGPVFGARILYAARRRLAGYDCDLRLVPLARKAVASPGKLGRHDSMSDFDRDVFDELEAANLPTINTYRLWTTAALEQGDAHAYCARDSHWTTTGQRIVAEAIAAQFPDIARHDVATSTRESSGLEAAMLLYAAGIDPRHPAWSLINERKMTRLTLEPQALKDELASPGFRGDVALVGTSFTGGDYDFHDLVVDALGTRVERFAMKGMPFLTTLAAFVKTRGCESLPSVVLYEFPLHQLAFSPLGSHAYGALFGALAPKATMDYSALPPAISPGIEGGPPEQLRVHFPQGTAVSSGDGVLCVELDISAPIDTEWVVRTASTELRLVAPKGGGRFVVPVLEGVDWVGEISVLTWGRKAAVATVDARLVLDVDPSSVKRIATSPTKEGGERYDTQVEGLLVPEQGTLLVNWQRDDEQSPAELIVDIVGTNASGEPKERRWAFSPKGSASAALSLRPWTSGQVDSITVHGPRGLELSIGTP